MCNLEYPVQRNVDWRAKLTHHSGSVGDGLFLGLEGLWLKNWIFFRWQVGLREVTEGGVLWPWKQRIVRGLEGLYASPGKAFFQVVLEDLTLGKSGSLASDSLLSHLVSLF